MTQQQRAPEPYGDDWKTWGRRLMQHLGQTRIPLVQQTGGESAADDGHLMWDRESSYPVVSKSGEWQEVVLAESRPSGIAQLDFGASSKTATVVVSNIGTISSTSVVLCAMRIVATAEHSVDDLLVDPIRLAITSIVAGTGFTIYGEMDNAPANGTYNVQWALV